MPISETANGSSLPNWHAANGMSRSAAMVSKFLLLLLMPLFAFATSDYSLTLYVSAKHFDYSSAESCLKSLSQNSDKHFGHAWVTLQGLQNGERVSITGGHSGECSAQPGYFDGVADLVEAGDPNPIRYLFSVRQDGFFQEGSGGHPPTFSAKRELTQEQFEAILRFMKEYSYREYSLSGQQCSSFVIAIAKIADWPLEGRVTLSIPPTLSFGGVRMRLWRDPRYRSLTLYTPDRLEQSLKDSVEP
jgi:hypothetical protein